MQRMREGMVPLPVSSAAHNSVRRARRSGTDGMITASRGGGRQAAEEADQNSLTAATRQTAAAEAQATTLPHLPATSLSAAEELLWCSASHEMHLPSLQAAIL